MTTLQEAQMKLIDAYADAVADYVASDYCMAGDNPNLGERAKEARAAVVAALAQQDDTDLLTIAYLDGRRKGKAEALAQQGEQQPVAWYEYNQDLDAWFLAYGHNPKAKTRPLVFGDTAAPVPQTAPVAWVWNPASIEWEKVRAFGHWQQGALYAFGPTQPEPLAAPAPAPQPAPRR